MPLLSLDCLTVTDTTPEDTIRAAAKAGFDLVSMWTGARIYPRQHVTLENRESVKAVLAETGIKISAIEVFDLASAEAVDSYRPALELASDIGGPAVVAINFSNPDRAEVVRLLRRFAKLAAEYGLGVNLEPIVVGHTRTLAEGAALIAEADVDAGLVFDFLHLVRGGGTADDVRHIDPALIRHVQVCDGMLAIAPDAIMTEGTVMRMMPGTGEFPVADLIAAVPPTAVIGVECPDLARMQAGTSADQMAAEGMAALRPFLARAQAG